MQEGEGEGLNQLYHAILMYIFLERLSPLDGIGDMDFIGSLLGAMGLNRITFNSLPEHLLQGMALAASQCRQSILSPKWRQSVSI